jgi:hypothetical protein
METQEYWISQGKIVPRPVSELGSYLNDKTLLAQRELVKVVITPAGATLKWVMFAANWTSLFFASDWISAFIGPITLEFFNAGWFTERLESASEAKMRIEQLIQKSDVHFSSRTYTRSFDPVGRKLPEMLSDVWSTGVVDESRAVHCAIDTERELTQVEHVGANSALAKVWGISPVTYPCLSGHSYDRVVSKSYYDVVRTGRPHYDHVLAAMVDPKGEVKWFGYHRLIFPKKKSSGQLPQVTVACEFALVDIPLL